MKPENQALDATRTVAGKNIKSTLHEREQFRTAVSWSRRKSWPSGPSRRRPRAASLPARGHRVASLQQAATGSPVQT